MSDESQSQSNQPERDFHERRPRRGVRRSVLTVGLLLFAIAWLGGRSFKPIDPNNIATPTFETPIAPTPTPLPSHFPNLHPESEPHLPGESGRLGFADAVAQCWPSRKPEEFGLQAPPGATPEALTLAHLSQIFGRLLKSEPIEEHEELELPDGRIRSLMTKGSNFVVLESDEDGIPNTKFEETDIERLGKSARDKLYESHRKGATRVTVERYLGLLFDSSYFPKGAAGTATEVNGEIRDLLIRAEGRILKCSTPNACECQ